MRLFYFRIAWRNISRHKLYTAINVLGLALGICACIVIFLITSYELSFDKFHPDKERIYRIVGEMQRNTGEKLFLNSPFPDVAGIEKQIPGFEASSGFYLYGGGISIPQGDKDKKKFENRIEGGYESSAIITWPQYFSVFSYEWLAGNPQSLSEPFRVVLSENRARAYFGQGSLDKMIGRTVIYDDSLVVQVSGIVKDWKGNTDFGFTDFISIGTATHSFLKNRIATEDWRSLQPHNSMAFVKLEKGTTAAQVNEKLSVFVKEHVKIPDPGITVSMRLQPLTDIHFTTDYRRGDDGDDFRKPYLPALYALMGIALFILVIAAVNFINLSTAQSMRRAKEIGVRKVLGSKRTGIVYQFLTETFLLTLLAVIVSVLLVNPVLSLFHSFIPPGIHFEPLQPATLSFLLIITLLTALFAGFYPARVLASYLPVLSLKGVAAQTGGSGSGLRKGLIVFQFTISLVFIIGAIVTGDQIRFMNKADKGFNSDAVIVLNKWGDREGKLKVFVTRIKNIPGVQDVTLQGNAPMGFAHGGENFRYKGKGPGERPKDQQVSFEAGDENFIPFYRMKLLAGRNIRHSDSLQELVINETYSKMLGFTNAQDAVGQFLYKTDKPFPIVGVVADFHEGSFQEAIKPVVIGRMPGREGSVGIKLAADQVTPGAVKKLMTEMEKEWKQLFPEDGFDYHFLNETISWLYSQEEKTSWLMNMAMCITIFISCMGLFGLSMFTAEKRTKEIGIRKVLGASVANIVLLLNRDFVRLVLLALFIASPIAWYFMNKWLADFAYRTGIGWRVFVLAGSGALFLALLTVSFQAIRAAVTNPVKSLKTE